MRSGFVSILGRPNSGKSTLLNALIGEKVAIVTPKPQTTRTRIHGILEVPAAKGKGSAAQIVFVDTPGVHRPGSQLDRRMMQEVHDALEHRDVVILLVDATRGTGWAAQSSPADMETAPAGQAESQKERWEETQKESPRESKDKAGRGGFVSKSDEDAFALSLIRKLDCPVFLVINKIDLTPKEKLLPLIAQLSSLHSFAEVIPVSARTKDGLDRLLKKLVEYLPRGQRYFPKDQFTDQPERFMVAELIRERILLETGEEVPYASAVVVERFEEPEAQAKNGVSYIAAAIYCERPGQKAILIGKGGGKLKSIGSAARKEIESLLGTRVYLELRVIVEENWRESRGFIESLNWRKQFDELSVAPARSGGQFANPPARNPSAQERAEAKRGKTAVCRQGRQSPARNDERGVSKK